MIVLFDGMCNLCAASVRFIVARDPAGRFRFAPLQSAAARRVLSRSSTRGPLPDSLVLVDGARVYTRSAAALRIARGLGFPWPLACIFVAVPRPLRDWVYDVVARGRYRWFGKREACMIPTPDLRRRFIDGSEIL